MTKIDTDRRRLLAGMAAIGPTLVFSSATAQQLFREGSELIRIISDPAEVEQLLEQMDLVWSIAALAMSRRLNQLPPPNARSAYSAIRVQIAQPDQRPQIVAALNTTTPQALRAQARALDPVLPQLRGLLIESGLRPDFVLVDQLLRGFATFTQLLVAKSSSNDHWWCRCYGLGVICT